MEYTRRLGHLLATVTAIATVFASAPGNSPAALAQQDSPGEEIASPSGALGPSASNHAEVWTPGAGASFNILRSAVITVTVDATYALANSGVYYIHDPNSGFGPATNATVSLSNFNQRAVMTATLNPNSVPNGASIYFSINAADNSRTATSPGYLLTREARVYLPVVMRFFGQPAFITGESACDAANNGRGGPLAPSTTYTVTHTRQDSWLFINNTTPNAAIVVSLTNYTITGQLQVRIEQGGCSNTQLINFATNPNPVVTVYNVPVGRVYFRVVTSGQAPPPYQIRWRYTTVGPLEPNNHPCEAPTIQPGVFYAPWSEDQYDFFAINITTTGQVQVRVIGHTIGGTQVQVRTPLKPGYVCPGNGADPINSTSRIDPFGSVPSGGGSVTVTVNITATGLYYIRVSLPSATGNSQPYQIVWNYAGPSGGTAGPIFTTNPNQPPACGAPPHGNPSACQLDIVYNINAGQSVTYYWFGMQALSPYDAIQLQVVGVNDLHGCGPGNPGTIQPPPFNNPNAWHLVGTLAPQGSVTLQFNSAGGYNIRLRVMQGATQKYYDAKPLKVSCGTLMAARDESEGASAAPAFEWSGSVSPPLPPDVQPHP
ncbi:MAG: hypothetical protein NZM18_06575 [Thermoflexales bacterium]|nr:hypothetical protein [Thermoflexales bacterium]